MNRSGFNDNYSMVSNMTNMTGMTRSNGEIAILFYSDRCNHSRAIMVTIANSPLHPMIKKVCVDNPAAKIPRIVTSVPTLIARGINRPLVGQEINDWVSKNMPSKQQSGGSMGGGAQISQRPSSSFAGSSSGPSAAQDVGLGCLMSSADDTYSFLEGVQDDGLKLGRFAGLNDDCSISTPVDASSSGKGNMYDSKKGNSDKTNMDLDRLKQERNSILGPRNPMGPNGGMPYQQGGGQRQIQSIPNNFNNIIKNI
jgi:hypothetical protein